MDGANRFENCSTTFTSDAGATWLQRLAPEPKIVARVRVRWGFCGGRETEMERERREREREYGVLRTSSHAASIDQRRENSKNCVQQLAGLSPPTAKQATWTRRRASQPPQGGGQPLDPRCSVS
ncbi:conserved hypothetical protein [Coccidioides posadasii str. Silveira]|uniref:Uncharacterized protein n=2 Tax=Coccidioides posadasii TaxID=199306 RepID=E9CX02_COCPS|nr:conserved hypothetical protein [Coccidioides posadasii str. Silveira]KMM65285.1 hypothetical protein CPAG_01636 [Coccidioides posadasii RMSCC 3488]